jgi:hypothetical protein
VMVLMKGFMVWSLEAISKSNVSSFRTRISAYSQILK